MVLCVLEMQSGDPEERAFSVLHPGREAVRTSMVTLNTMHFSESLLLNEVRGKGWKQQTFHVYCRKRIADRFKRETHTGTSCDLELAKAALSSKCKVSTANC